MSQIEELFKLCYKPGMSEEEFLHELAAESFRVSCSNFSSRKELQKVYKEIKNGTRNPMPGLKWILDSFYMLKREVPAVSGATYAIHEQKAMLKAMQDDSLMELMDQNGTHTISGEDVEDMERSFLHRWPKNRHQNGWSTGDTTFGRFTVNADMNPQMIKDLDKFCSKHKCQYKTAYPSTWSNRVDPVNIYIHEPITENLKKEFVSVMKKYVRNSRPDLHHLLDGDVLSPGITCAAEWTFDEGIKFIRSMPVQFQNDAFKFAHGNGKKIAMSLGQRMVLEEFSELYKKYAPKFQKDTKLKASTSKKITPQKIVLAPEQKTFSKIIKGKKLLTTMASLSENNVDVFKIFNEKDNLKQMVVSTGKYQTVFNYVQEKVHNDDPFLGPSDVEITSFQSMIIQDKTGKIYGKFIKTPKGYVLQKSSSLICTGFKPTKDLNKPFSLDDEHGTIRFGIKESNGETMPVVNAGFVLGQLRSLSVVDGKGRTDAVDVLRGGKPMHTALVHETELSYIETTSSHPKEIQILPYKDKRGLNGVRVLDEKGQEIYTRVKIGENDFENIYPNGLRSRTWKDKDGTINNLIWDPRDKSGMIRSKNGRIIHEAKDQELRQKIANLQKQGRTYGQIQKRLQKN